MWCPGKIKGEGNTYNYDQNSILLRSETKLLPEINIGKNLQPKIPEDIKGPWSFICNGCSSSPKEIGIARYICLYCRSDPNFFGDFIDICEECMSQYLNGNEEKAKVLERNGHQRNHPFVRCLYMVQDYKNYWFILRISL